MEKWGKPDPTQPPPRPAAPVGGSVPPDRGVQPPASKVGFAKAFDNLVGRKRQELKGARWEAAKATAAAGGKGAKGAKRALDAEARRRAAAEMARRIERQTGRRPKESTIRRAAREDRTPRGVDQAKLDRQARIDKAGGVKKFADKAGVPAKRVAGWRDSGKVMGVGGVRITVSVTGDLYSPPDNPTPYRKVIDAILQADPPASDELRAADAAGDLGALAQMLGPVIDAQYDWTGDADGGRRFIVTEINSITLE